MYWLLLEIHGSVYRRDYFLTWEAMKVEGSVRSKVSKALKLSFLSLELMINFLVLDEFLLFSEVFFLSSLDKFYFF